MKLTSISALGGPDVPAGGHDWITYIKLELVMKGVAQTLIEQPTGFNNFADKETILWQGSIEGDKAVLDVAGVNYAGEKLLFRGDDRAGSKPVKFIIPVNNERAVYEVNLKPIPLGWILAGITAGLLVFPRLFGNKR